MREEPHPGGLGHAEGQVGRVHRRQEEEEEVERVAHGGAEEDDGGQGVACVGNDIFKNLHKKGFHLAYPTQQGVSFREKCM